MYCKFQFQETYNICIVSSNFKKHTTYVKINVCLMYIGHQFINESTRLHQTPPESTGLHWTPVDSSTFTGVQWSPVESSGVQWSPVCDILVTQGFFPESGGLCRSLVESGGLRRSQWGSVKYWDKFLKYYQNCRCS